MEKFANIQVSTENNYTVPDMAKLFHSFPRISIKTFQPVSPEFDLRVDGTTFVLTPYFESLITYPAGCTILLMLTILITGIISCCMCCRTPPETKSGNLKCLKFFIVAFSILIGCSSVIGGYGNIQCAEGTEGLVESSNNISTHVTSIQDEVIQVGDSLDDTAYSLDILRSAYDYIFETTGEESAREASDKVKDAAATVRVVEDQLDQQNKKWKVFNHNEDLEVIKTFIVDMEFMRNVSTWSLLGWCALISFVVFLAVLCTSEVFLMVGAVMGIFGLIAAFAITSWYLMFALGVSDFCMDPQGVFYNQSDFSKRTDMAYFLNCPDFEGLEARNANLQYSELQKAFDHYNEGNKTLMELKQKSQNGGEVISLMFGLVERNMADVKKSLDLTRKKAECTVVHRNLVSGLNALCYTYLEGVDFIFGAGLITAICLFILVILSACTWGQMERHAEYCAGSYDHLDDPYRRTTGSRHDNGRYGMYAGGNYHRLGPAGASREGHPPPPSYHI